MAQSKGDHCIFDSKKHDYEMNYCDGTNLPLIFLSCFPSELQV